MLGRPGSGCTSLLRVLSNDRDSFDEVAGETRFASMDHKEAKRYRQQIMFNNEGTLQYSVSDTFVHGEAQSNSDISR